MTGRLAPETTPRSEATADRVWIAAAELFRERGYAATTTRQLAERLGITKATLYYHIKKKEDLLYGICREALHRVGRAASEALESSTDPHERIRLMMRAHLTSMLTDIDMHATMLLELDDLTGEYRTEIVSLRNDYETMVTEAIAEAQAAGAIRADLSARRMTLALMNLLNWTISWYRPEGELDPERLADLFSSIYLNGAKPRV